MDLENDCLILQIFLRH